MVDEQVDPFASNQLNPLMESIENKLLVIAIGPAEWSSNHFIAVMSRGDRHDAFSRPGMGPTGYVPKMFGDVFKRVCFRGDVDLGNLCLSSNPSAYNPKTVRRAIQKSPLWKRHLIRTKGGIFYPIATRSAELAWLPHFVCFSGLWIE